MTTSLFSQVIHDVGGETGITGFNKLALGLPLAKQSFLVNAVLDDYWQRTSDNLSASGTGINPSAVLMALSSMPEVQDISGDTFI